MKKTRLDLRITEEQKNIVFDRARDLDLSTTDYICSLIEKDAASIVSDENVLLYHYEELKRNINKVDNKVEEIGQLFLAYLTAFFRTQPPLYSEDMTDTDWGKANETTIQWLTVHRDKLRHDNKPFLYRIFGSLLEVDGSFKTKDDMESEQINE